MKKKKQTKITTKKGKVERKREDSENDGSSNDTQLMLRLMHWIT